MQLKPQTVMQLRDIACELLELAHTQEGIDSTEHLLIELTASQLRVAEAIEKGGNLMQSPSFFSKCIHLAQITLAVTAHIAHEIAISRTAGSNN